MNNIYKKITWSVFSIAALAILTSTNTINNGHDTFDSGGKIGFTGSPGENTCSNTGCHGAGKGGLADNGGSGSVAITSSPAFTFDTYIPGTTYTITVTVAEAGKSLYGFDFEALDNSGSTNPSSNNSVGTITITNSTKTQTALISGVGRRNVTHKSNGGSGSGSAAFSFNWTAPTSGTVKMYATGNATDKNGGSSAGDNIYKTSLTLSPSATGVLENGNNLAISSVYPNPVSDQATIAYSVKSPGSVTVSVLDLNGKSVKEVQNSSVSSGAQMQNLSCTDIASGVYYVRVQSGLSVSMQKIAVIH